MEGTYKASDEHTTLYPQVHDYTSEKRATSKCCFPTCSRKTMGGSAAVAVGIVLVILAAIFASGVFGAGKFYFAAGAMAVFSIPLFILGAYYLASMRKSVGYTSIE